VSQELVFFQQVRNTANVTLDIVLGQVNTAIGVAYSQANTAYGQANTATSVGQAAYNQANTSYSQANTATQIGQAAFTEANSAYSYAGSAYNLASSTLSILETSLNTVNNNISQAVSIAEGAYYQANTGTQDAQAAYAQANSAYAQAITATSDAQGAYAEANSAYSYADSAYALASAADNTAIAANAATGVSAGSYGGTRSVAGFTTDARGRILNAENYGIPTFSTAGDGFVPAPSSSANNVFLASNGSFVVPLGGGNQSIGGSGWTTLPGGLILQWGTFAMSGGFVGPINFPKGFPTACIGVTVTGYTGNQSIASSIEFQAVTTFTAGQFRYYSNNSGQTGFYMAIGY
jgi:hypothetical protein